MNNLEKIVWPGLKRLEPSSKLGGIYAKKRGYHNHRRNLPASDYSVQLPADKRGPDDEPAAIDWTFPDAQRGDYRTIAKYSRRLLTAGQNRDPRMRFWREFFGNTDSDREVEGWDFVKGRPSTSDTSHLWHIHASELREYVDDPEAGHAFLSVVSGETYADYLKRTARKVTMVKIDGELPALLHGDTDETVPGGTTHIRRAQALLDYLAGPCTIDGDYGDGTAAAVKRMMAGDDTRSTSTGREIGLPEWRRLTGIW